MMKNNSIIILTILILSSCTTFNTTKENNTISREVLEKKIQNLKNEYGGIIGVYAKNFFTGETISVNGDSLFPTASVIKLPILVELFYRIRNKEINPETYILIPDSVKVGGAGVLQFFYGDLYMKIIDVATLMIILSDNTATNAIIDLFALEHDDKLYAVNSRMEKLGLENTKLLNKVFSIKTKKNTPEAIRYGLGYSSPSNMVKLLEMIYKFELIDSLHSAWILKIMKAQQDDTMIRRLLPYDKLKANERIEVAHKTGAISKSRIDVGIVYAPKAEYAIAIFADLSKDESWTLDNKAQNAVAKASKIIYDYFNR